VRPLRALAASQLSSSDLRRPCQPRCFVCNAL
jgi:hypothetical protein